MKTRIIGTLFVIIILLVLFVLTGGDNSSQPTNMQAQPTPQSSSDRDLKDLKIN